jgi:hypothetical protein
LLASSLYPAYLSRNVADMVDQGRLVPSFLSYLKISMCTGTIFTVHKRSYYCSYGPGGAQEKNTSLLPILAPDRWLKWRQRCTSACGWNGLRGIPGRACHTDMGLLPLDRVLSLGDNHHH